MLSRLEQRTNGTARHENLELATGTEHKRPVPHRTTQPSRAQQSSFFTITVYIEDINDNDPEFINLPYVVTLDESTPIETVVFNRIKAIDRDKPNTPNSDLEYALAAKHMKSGDFPFRLEGSQRPSLVLQRALDYDAGWRSMSVQIVASDRGNPPRTANATIRVNLRDVDDLPPIFTRAQYRTRIKESFPLTVSCLSRSGQMLPILYYYLRNRLLTG